MFSKIILEISFTYPSCCAQNILKDASSGSRAINATHSRAAHILSIVKHLVSILSLFQILHVVLKLFWKMPHHALGQNTTSMRWLSKLRNLNKIWTVAINASHPRAEHCGAFSGHCLAFDEHCWVFLSRIIVSLKKNSSVSLGIDLIWQISLLPFPSIFTHVFWGKNEYKHQGIIFDKGSSLFSMHDNHAYVFLTFFIVMLNDTLFCV